MRRLPGLVLATLLIVGLTSGLAVGLDPQAATAAPSSSELDAARRTILGQTNAARAGKGLAPLRLNASLNTVAQNWTKKMSDSGVMGHNPDYFRQYPAGASSGAENVAFGYAVERVTPAWLNSPGHYANIMSKSTDIGIGYYYGSDGRPYYTQNFASYSATTIEPLTPPAPSSWKDFTGDGRPDVAARDSAGYLWLYRGNGSGLGSRVRIGSGWGTMTTIMAGGDFSGDGRADVIARDAAGDLWLYHGTDSGLGSRVRIGWGWTAMTALAAGGDFTGDGRADVLARDSAGALWLYGGTGSGLGARVKIGSGWNGMTSIAAGGDFSGDGRADVIARDTSGYLWQYRGTGSGLGSRVQIGSGWNLMTAITAGGDLNGDGRTEVVARDKSGYLWLYRGTATGLGAREQIGSGWNVMTAIL
ncbi:hypothetical protein E3T33_10040 [Cryobacterium sp. TMT1-2-1]|uniref:FG-GAP-like repeat-containing protein n=1 Tax=Cryobacterium sp. TMT1-2-1 TaxID=1259232 RepID=UPI00106CACB5|nr:FG-GAP-like repeat-containing protein [Cryobacterium sp. TMT1-2-1]TFD43796.1 hypothetical protein E3T33_10040 [Cryobacterium sp. TMT1-2-1]